MKAAADARAGALVGIVAALTPAAALAHTGRDVAGGLLAGALHPLSGMDHMLAMVAVGLWGAQLGSPALWLLPVTFPTVMAVAVILILTLPSSQRAP